MAEKMTRRIAIDLALIRPGRGGTGSGIWTYVRELVLHLDRLDSEGMELICLVNRRQIPAFSNLRNVRLVCFPDFGKNLFIRLLWVHLLLPLFCLFRRIDLLHRPATETPLFCPSRRVTTVHDFFYEYLMEQRPAKDIRLHERLEHFYFSLVTRICFRVSRTVITVSDAVCREAALRYPAAADRLRVIPHGHPPVPDVRPEPNGPFNILCAAKFMEHKGQHLLIAAFDTLLENHPDLAGKILLTLRGFQNDEDYYERIQQQVQAGRWSGFIRLVPFRPQDGPDLIYKDVHLTVLLSSCEGFGLPVLEAQCFGIPVLCSDLPVLREVGGDGALYVDRSDPAAIARILLELVSDKELRSRQIHNGFENIRRFNWQDAAKKTMDVYRQVMHCAVLALLFAGLISGPSARAWTRPEDLPLLPAGERIIQVSSHDRSGANDDGFTGACSALYERDGRYVLLDESGPGRIDRIWMTKITATNCIRVFLDGESEPSIDTSLGSMFSGTNSLFPAPLAGDDTVSSGGFYSFVPIAYSNGCRVTVTDKPYFYQITAHRFPYAGSVQSWTPEQDWSGLIDLWNQCGESPFSDFTAVTGSVDLVGGTEECLFSETGDGCVGGLRLWPGAAGRYCLTNVWLSMRWDGADTPQVQVPLGDFFGCRFSVSDVNALMFGMQTNGSWYCYFPMPFWDSAEILLENHGTQDVSFIEYSVDFLPQRYDREMSGWFCADFRSRSVVSDRQDVSLLSTNGWGRIVGLNLGILNRGKDPLGYLEGDERIYLDGSRTPQIYGTGTEDFFNGGWYFNHGLFSLPLHGLSACKHEWRSDWNVPPYITNNFTSAYRLFLGDSIPFYTQAEFGIEHGYSNSQSADYMSTVFFYRHPDRSGLAQAADISVGDSESEAAAAYQPQGGEQTSGTWKFEGDDDTLSLTFAGYTGIEQSRFSISICSTNAGLLLRRTMDAGTGFQEGAVFVNVVFAGTWISPDCNFSNVSTRWADSEYLIPAELTAGGSNVCIEVVSLGDHWNEYGWQVFAIETTASGADYDNDSLPDSWEVLHFTNILFGAASSDTDADGLDAHAEYIAGTDPQDTQSSLDVHCRSDAIVFPSVTGRQYQVQFRSGLTTGRWETVRSGIVGTSEPIEYDLSADLPGSGYYRVMVSLPQAEERID
jgi:glycosyltransferase involved in cell wall biosynthesis